LKFVKLIPNICIVIQDTRPQTLEDNLCKHEHIHVGTKCTFYSWKKMRIARYFESQEIGLQSYCEQWRKSGHEKGNEKGKSIFN